MEATLVVDLLGGVRVGRSDGTVVSRWERPSTLRLLCLLMLSPGRVVDRSVAAGVLHPHLNSDRAVAALAKDASRCRSALGPSLSPALVASNGRLSWAGPVTVDVEPALNFTRGAAPTDLNSARLVTDDARELLPGWDTAWVEPFRDEVARGRLAAARTVALALVDGTPSEVAESVARWQRVATADPLDEQAQAGLLRGLLRLGQVEPAQRAYLSYRRLLWTELRAEPGSDVESVWNRHTKTAPISATSAAPASPAPAADGVGAAATSVGGRLRRQEALIGRDSEMTQLEAFVEHAWLGHGGVVTVIGDAGLGKTALLAEVAERWRQRGGAVLVPRPQTADAAPYAAVADVLRDLTARSTTARAAVSRLLTRPARAQPLSGAGQPRHAPEPRDPTMRDSPLDPVVEALGHLTGAELVLPTLVLIDDLAALDPSSARLLRECVRRGSLPWSLICANRTDAHALPGGTVTVLHRLGDHDIEHLVRALANGLDDAAVAHAVTLACGNPRFALEVAALMAGRDDTWDATPIPPSATEVVRSCLDGLPGPQRAVLPLAILATDDASTTRLSTAVENLGPAVNSRPTTTTGTSVAASTAMCTTRATLDVLVRSGLLVETSTGFVPTHPLIGAAAVARLSRTQRAALHDALAAAHADHGHGGASSPGEDGAAAAHRVAAFNAMPDPTRAARAMSAAVSAARRQLERGLPRDAAEMARCASRAWSACVPADRERLHDALLEAQLLLGQALSTLAPLEAHGAYEAGLQACARDDDRARFLTAQGWLHYQHGELTRAAGVYRRGLDLPHLAAPVRATLSAHLGWVLARQGIYDRAMDLYEQARRLLDGRWEPGAMALIQDRRGMTLAFTGDLDAASRELDQAYATCIYTDAPALRSAIQTHRGNVSGRLGVWDPALRYLDEAVDLARAAGDFYVESVAWWARTDVLHRKGDDAEALEANEEEQRALQLAGNPVHLAASRRRRERLLHPDPSTNDLGAAVSGRTL